MSHKGISTKANEHGIHDIHLDETGNLAMAFDAEIVGQHARQRTMAFKGEWFLNADVGVPWLEQIMGKAYDPAMAESVIKAVIKKTDGVTRITSFSVSFNRVRRELAASSISVMTEYDQEVEL